MVPARIESAIQNFTHDGMGLRVLIEKDEPWFVAADVCSALGTGNPSEALRHLDEDEKMTLSNPESHSGSRGGAQSFAVISESGLYTLILRSRKPQARPFRRWVTHEVLPALRKNGTYNVQPLQPTLFPGEAYPERFHQPAAEKLDQARKCAKGSYELLKNEVLPLLKAERAEHDEIGLFTMQVQLRELKEMLEAKATRVAVTPALADNLRVLEMSLSTSQACLEKTLTALHTSMHRLGVKVVGTARQEPDEPPTREAIAHNA